MNYQYKDLQRCDTMLHRLSQKVDEPIYDWLQCEYIDKRRSLHVLCAELEIQYPTLRRIMNFYSIEIRSRSETMRIEWTRNNARKPPIWPKGKPRSKETKKKISIALTGRKLSPEHRRKMIAIILRNRKPSEETKQKISITLKGHEVTKETRQKISEVAKGKLVGAKNPAKRPEVRAKISTAKLDGYASGKIERLIGEKNPNWKGGGSSELYGPEFNNALRAYIRKRDDFTCQKCGKGQRESFRALDVHHIDYNKRNNDSSNLIALCCSCNAKATSNRSYWQPFFEQLIETKLEHEWLRPVHRLETMV